MEVFLSAKFNITLDGKEYQVAQDLTILEAAQIVGHNIPTLCYHKDLSPTGNCGICVVEVENSLTPHWGCQIKRACITPVSECLHIKTNSKNLRNLRRTLVELILSNHEVVCPTCEQNQKCELQKLSYLLGIEHSSFPTILRDIPIDKSSFSIVRDTKKCISCGRCLTVCSEVQTVHALTQDGRGFDTIITTAFNHGMGDSVCVNCGQCTVYCPTGALRERSAVDDVWNALLDEEKYVVVQEAPAVRAMLAEEFGMDVSKVTVGKMYAALRKLGFNRVFDTNFTADLTIMEEGTELINRIKSGGKLPLITSCSPGWVKFMETYFPDLAEHVSTCKSPQQMFGALVKTYFAKEENIDAAKIVSVSIMPCTAKKFEAARPEMNDSGYRDVDYVLTTREFIKMIKEAGIDFATIAEEKADDLMGQYTGAGTIFGATGGVMEAAIRSAYYLLVGENLPNLDLKVVRGLQGIKEATLKIPTKEFGELEVNIAVAHGLGNARMLMEKVKAGEKKYHFIEIMACPGGCVGGGGQPYGSDMAGRARRGQALYNEDKELTLRQSHENPGVHRIYKEFLNAPCSEKSHQLLHTNYFQRSNFDGKVEKEVTHKHE
jgi:NADH-quinone oxidoreductase subunit G